jgi:hypothetical protein
LFVTQWPSASNAPGFDLGLVPGLVGPGGDEGHGIVGGHLLIGGVDVGLVALRAVHPRAQVVAHHDLGRAEELGGMDVARHPVEKPSWL